MRIHVSHQFVAEHISFLYNVTIIKNGPHALTGLTANHMRPNFPFLFSHTRLYENCVIFSMRQGKIFIVTIFVRKFKICFDNKVNMF